MQNSGEVSAKRTHNLFAFLVSKQVKVSSEHFYAPKGSYDADKQVWIGDDTIYASSKTCKIVCYNVCTGSCYPGYSQDSEARCQTVCDAGV